MQASSDHHRHKWHVTSGFWGLCVLVLCLGAQAQAASTNEAAPDISAILHQVQSAARQLDYSGVLTYQQGAAMQSARIVHIVDGTGERERLEILDGIPREYLRHDESVQGLIPEKKIIVVEPGRADRFPGLLLGDAAKLPQHYHIKQYKTPSRIAGHVCTVYEIHPKDNYRYGYKLCVESGTNLLLKEQTINTQGEVIDQVAFSILALRDQVRVEKLASPLDTRGWKVIQNPTEPVDVAKLGWRISVPPGFEPVTQVSRPMKSGKAVKQLVYSDGLAAVSVFIETAGSGHGGAALPKGASRNGVMNIFGGRIGEYWITAIGEVPPVALRELVERTEYVPLAATQ